MTPPVGVLGREAVCVGVVMRMLVFWYIDVWGGNVTYDVSNVTGCIGLYYTREYIFGVSTSVYISDGVL